MSIALQHELDRADLLAQSPYRSGRYSRVIDAAAGTAEAEDRLRRHGELIERATANQVTADNPGLMPTTVLNTPLAAASAPVLTRLASVLGRGVGKPQVAGSIVIPAVVDPTEKNPTWPSVDGSGAVAPVLHLAAAALDLSFQVSDWAANGGADYDSALEASALAALEAKLLADLVAGGTTATDLPSAIGACNPPADTIIGPASALLAGAPLLAQLAQAGAGLTLIATPNTTATIVLARAAVTLAVSAVTIGRTMEPGLLGQQVGAYCYGVAAPHVATAVQMVS